MSDVESLLDEAIAWVERQKDTMSEALKIALNTRLCLRKKLLQAVALDTHVIDQRQRAYWCQCSELLPNFLHTIASGVAVKESFSAKIQRRLASTVPPRPIVEISLVDAHAHLKRLCRDATEVVQVLDYNGGSNLMVRTCGFL